MDEQLNVTSLKIKKFGQPKNGVLGLASLVLLNSLMIHDIKIVQLSNKRILSFPAQRILKAEETEDGISEHYIYSDIVHPINSQFRRYLEDIIFNLFDSMEGGTTSEQNY